jgi:hypothetical protein
MTFYNIIFGILFVGACQTVLIGWLQGGDTLLLLFVTVLIFNDVVNTSEVIEEREFHYTISMKLLDLLSFFALSTALILLSGNYKNFLEVDHIYAELPPILKHDSAPPIALLVYCLSVIGWNLASKDLRKASEWKDPLLRAAAAAIVVATVVLIFLRPSRVDNSFWYGLVVAVGIIATVYYLVSYTVIGDAPSASEPTPQPK